MKRALIVDDDDDIRFLVRNIFELRGWAVDEEPNGPLALERRANDYDVILLDQKMPGLAGSEVGAELRRTGFTGPIIFYSANLSTELESKLKREVNIDLTIIAKTDLDKLVSSIDLLTNAD